MSKAPGQIEHYDVAVIGGGVVGCATARRFALEGARVLLLEKGADILSGASKANSAILHTGFDAPSGSQELACMQRGYAEYREIAQRLNLPLLETGAMVVAWNDADEAKLDAILAQAHANGVEDVVRISRDAVRQREPALSSQARGAVWVPGEHVIDPWSAPLAYLQQAMANGAHVWRGATVEGGAFDGKTWTLLTTLGEVRSTEVINCAGLFGDHLERALLGEASFTIHPRKGQFVVFDKAAAAMLSSIILPVPNERTKGVVLTRTIYGNLLVGPTAEEQEDRDHASLDEAILDSLVADAITKVPALEGMPITATYAGLRPATEQKAYRLKDRPEANWITLGGVRSTGLTAALGLAEHAFACYRQRRATTPIGSPVWPAVPNLAEHLPRDWQQPGYEEIVCHCELVTRREIEAALESPLPPGNIGGLKRRTRACMGRCQGFYCGARVAELTGNCLTPPISTGIWHE
ncbi:NAD(P)/FAD-dependent oxidoreductase [Salinicola rhizosphaerae]|uniref:FAD/NAD(P)-binding oxidoreductase n=1 Tax=Salinicola rhizosphaerae TaxID=1443141 RepID=A0ABQ3DZQ3_9GAMM|nr:NAD(P)/FAD-dependent oxidoreductase [Salinicola rhizosphaerae]GHB21504.1 FAD/NAD(P)-binding oxidoreductase [Salinicola rhizosphaerae]